MCGIAGLLNLEGQPVDGAQVGRMCDVIRHRGPDDSGLWVKGPIALGHRRLSIIDLSPRARNPITNEDETVWLTFNGEIYNYKEIRAGLRERGHIFRSESDSEVLVHLYEERGEDCVEALNGMFAFAIWDTARRRLLLARDRFGVKPLYYTMMGEALAFASEAKAFLALDDFKVRPDPLALAEHFTFQNTFGERTFFENVKLLEAGHYLLCCDGEIKKRRYWDLQFKPDASVDLKEWAAVLQGEFKSAVARQLMSDVPLGCYLSGGMDTGAISAVAASYIRDMHTFTCGFELPEDATELEQFFDERRESNELARKLGTLHHELELDADAMARVLPRVVWHLDEPRVGICYQVYCTAEMIRRYVTVVLSGVGGDELFAGYPWRYESIAAVRASDFEAEYYKTWIRFLTDEQKQEFFSPRVTRELAGYSTFDSFKAAAADGNGYDSLHRALYFDFKTFLNGLLLVDDKLTMAHSVEGRVPFLDNDLVDTVTRIPSELKFNNGQTKIVLKEAMRGLLPSETIARRKQGFTPPDQSWYKRKALGYIRDLILSPRALERDYFRPAYLEKILDDHLNDRCNNRFLIWSLMCFEWWNRLFVDRERLTELSDDQPEHQIDSMAVV